MDETLKLKKEHTLPNDQDLACLIGRAWVHGNPDGPSPVWIDNGKVNQVTKIFDCQKRK